MFNANVIYLFARAKSLLYNTTGSDILQINAHKRTPVSRTNMMKFRYCIEVVMITYYHAVVKIGRCCCTQWRVLLPFKQKNQSSFANSIKKSMVSCGITGNNRCNAIATPSRTRQDLLQA